MRLVCYVAILFILGLPVSGGHEHRKANNIKQVSTIVDQLLSEHKPEDILVVWDIDMTLIQIDHSCDYYPVMKKYHDIYKQAYKGLSLVGRDMMGTKIGLSHKARLVDPNAKQRINALKKKGVKNIALTAMLTKDPCDHAGPVPERRYKQLAEYGITFDDAYPWAPKSHTFTSLPTWAKGHPTLYRGILQSNGSYKTTKGQTLVAFLNLLREYTPSSKLFQMPKIIVFADDSRRHVEEVGKTLAKLLPQVTYVGVIFGGAYHYAPKIPTKEKFTAFWMGFRKATDRCLSEKKCCD